MAKKDQPEPQDFTKDEHWGNGGRFIVDPKTGCRIPAEQCQDANVNNQNDEEVKNAD